MGLETTTTGITTLTFYHLRTLNGVGIIYTTYSLLFYFTTHSL